VKEPVAVLPWESVAEQLTVEVPRAKIEPEAGMHETLTGPSTVSVAVGAKLTGAPSGLVASTAVMSAGRVRAGGVVSSTVTVKDPFTVLLWESVDEHATVVVVMENMSPDEGLQLTASDPSTKSLAETVKVTTAPCGPVASTVILAGKCSVGAVVSRTVTKKKPVPTFWWASVDEQSTSVTPSEKTEPDAEVQVTLTLPSTMSVAETLKTAGAPLAAAASAVILPGRVRTGGVVSLTLTLKDPLLWLP